MIAGAVDALASFNAGRGFTIPIPVTSLGPYYSLDITFRLCEERPPPFPSLGPAISWNLTDIPLPNELQFDGVDRAQIVAVADSTPRTGAGSGCLDIVTLIELGAERARTTGSVGNDCWTPFLVAYLHQQRRAGLLVVKAGTEEDAFPLLAFDVCRRRRGHRR